jgi:hypothetical protein
MGCCPVKVSIRLVVPIRIRLGMGCICKDVPMVKNDLGPDLEFNVVDCNDAPVNLTGKTAKFFLKRFCLTDAVNALHPDCVITDPANGKAVYKFQPGDLSEVGTYFGDFQVSNVSGYVETAPEAVRITVRDTNG